MKLNRLFSPITVNNMEIKNRTIMPSFHLTYTPGGFANDRIKEFYYKRAEGGVGLIIVGGFRIDENSGDINMCSLSSDEFIPGYTELTSGIHERGAKVAAQLMHNGGYARSKTLVDGGKVLAPSAVKSRFTGETPTEMTLGDINECIDNYAAAALRAKNAGFDAVEISAASGYLLSQFLSPLTNKREDEYGGSPEKRAKFPLDVIAKVREAVGPDYPVFMRIAGNDFVKGSSDNDNALEFAKLIEKAGIDLINVTGGWHESKVPQITGELPRGGFVYLARAVKEAVDIPVLACNRITDPVLAEEILALGNADLIGLARTLLADPEWVNKAEKGRFGEIRHCIACNQGCLSKTFFGKPVECLVNGFVGREYEIEIKKTKEPKNILVIGSGPAGLEFAITARQRGHNVTVWEKEKFPGGQLNYAHVPPGKEEFETLIDYQMSMAKKLGISIEFGKTANPPRLMGLVYDAVIFATGATPKMSAFSDYKGKINIVSSIDILKGDFIPGENVVVVGGGSLGCETAQYLASRGTLNKDQLMFMTIHNSESPEKISELLNNSSRKVSIIEMQKKLGANFDPGTGWPVFAELKRLKVDQYNLSTVKAIHDDSVTIERTVEDPAGAPEASKTEIIEIPCDTIVLAMGSKSNDELYNKVKDVLPNVYNIGDSEKPGKVIDAIKNAIDLAIALF